MCRHIEMNGESTSFVFLYTDEVTEAVSGVHTFLRLQIGSDLFFPNPNPVCMHSQS